MFSNKFIQATKEYCTFDNHVNAPLMRKVFYARKSSKGKITICGLGFYRLFINGKEITKSHLAPYISNINHYIYYDEYVLDDLLNEGKNVIGIILGNGMLNCMGGYTWGFDKANYRSAPKVAFALNIDDNIIEADETVKVNKSPITFDDLRCGERYDANLEIENWLEIDFDDSSWNNAIISSCPNGEKRITNIEPIVVEKEVKPVRLFKSGKGYIYDFGINSAGIIKLSIDGKKNQRIKLLHGEIVKEGKLDLTNIVFKGANEEYSQCIIYICKEGRQVYTPSFTYMGFQYVYVEGIEENQANEKLLTMLVMHSDIKRISNFKCSNEDLNKIFNNTINSTFSNFFHFPTDCPQREKNGWTGDANISMDQIMMNFNAKRNIKEWLRNIRKSQNEIGQIPGIIPTYDWGYQWGHGPAWDSALVELPYRVYQYENDTDIIYENAAFIFKYVQYLSKKINEKGLVEYGLGDWCEVEAPAPDKYSNPLCVSDTLMSINIFRKAAVLFGVINYKEEKEFCEKYVSKLINSFRKECIDDNLEVIGKTQTGQAMALYYGVFTKEEEQTAVDHLINYIRNENDHFKVGVLGGRVLFRVLSKFGYNDLVIKLITNPTFPSYSWQLKFGTTTLWESFYDMDENFNMYSNMTFEVLSMNHHFWGDVSAYFIEYILGLKINPELNDKLDVIIEPHLSKELTFAEGYHDFSFGRIYIKWEIKDSMFNINIQKPNNINCKLILPNNQKVNIIENDSNYKVIL